MVALALARPELLYNCIQLGSCPCVIRTGGDTDVSGHKLILQLGINDQQSHQSTTNGTFKAHQRPRLPITFSNSVVIKLILEHHTRRERSLV